MIQRRRSASHKALRLRRKGCSQNLLVLLQKLQWKPDNVLDSYQNVLLPLAYLR